MIAETLTLLFAGKEPRTAASDDCIYSRRTAVSPLKESDSGTNISCLLYFNCRSRRCVGRTVSDTESDHIPHSAAGGSIECDRKGWLQQTPAHARNRIRERRSLSLPRRAASGLSPADVRGIESALLRFKHQRTLSLDPGSVAAKGASIYEVN
jgi:hypothetical protein